MAKRIATISGTALVPGVSKNGRLYTREAIAKAVATAQDRIKGDGHPLTMLSHHQADDDSTRIVGRIRSLSVAEDGSAKFTADLADTDHARTIASLVSGDEPFLKGVSIRGAWVGQIERKMVDGQRIECAPALELDGLDFTRKPGVEGAVIDNVQTAGQGARESDGRHLIYESAEALVTFTEDATAEQTAEADTPALSKRGSGLSGTGKVWADPGYQPDKKQRYDLTTRDNAKTAWSYINQKAKASKYTPAQLKRIKGRIKSALKRFGVTIAAENWLIDSADAVTESGTIAEGMYDGDGGGTFCLNATNGPLSITLSSYCVDPADMEVILHAIVDSAVLALKNVDPDMDADMDIPGADAEDTDHDMPESAPELEQVTETETAPELPATEDVAEEIQDPAPEPDADHKETEVPAVSEPTTQAVEQTPAAPTEKAEPSAMDALNAKFDQLTAAITGLVTKMTPAPAPVPAEAAPVAQQPVAEAAPAPKVAETQEQMVARLVNERLAAERTTLIQEMVEAGNGPSRKGLVATGPVNEHRGSAAPAGEGLNQYGVPSAWPDKPLHEYTPDEREQYFGPALLQHALGSRYQADQG